MPLSMRTTEFWLTLLAIVGAIAAFEAGALSGAAAALMVTIAAVAYALFKGIEKFNGDLKRGYRTTEFWIALASIAGMGLTVVPNERAAFAAVQIAGIIAAYTASRALAKPAFSKVTRE